MTDQRHPEEWNDLEKELAHEAYTNAETPDEKLKVLTFVAGVPLDLGITNLCINASEKSVRSALAALLLALVERGDVRIALSTMQAIAVWEAKDGR